MLFSLRLAQNIILCGLFSFIIIVQQDFCTSYSTELPLLTPWLMKYPNSRLESLNLARCYLQTFDFSVLAVETRAHSECHPPSENASFMLPWKFQLSDVSPAEFPFKAIRGHMMSCFSCRIFKSLFFINSAHQLCSASQVHALSLS